MLHEKSLQDVIHVLDHAVLPSGNNHTDLFRLRGVMRGGVVDAKGATYDLGQEDGGDLDEWDNIPAHSLMVTIVADILAQSLHISPRERYILNLATWFHDSDKKRERNWQRDLDTNSPESTLKPDVRFNLEDESITDINAQKAHAFTESGASEVEENAQYGIPPEASRLMDSVNPPTADGHDNLLEKIMWFADACVRGTTFMSIDNRIHLTAHDKENGERNRAYSEMMREKYDGKSLYEVQTELGMRYVKEFSEALGINSDDFYQHLQQAVSEYPVLNDVILDPSSFVHNIFHKISLEKRKLVLANPSQPRKHFQMLPSELQRVFQIPDELFQSIEHQINETPMLQAHSPKHDHIQTYGRARWRHPTSNKNFDLYKRMKSGLVYWDIYEE